MDIRTFLVFPGGKNKAFTLSYDDAVDTDIQMIELMEKYGIKGTFNLNAGMFNKEGTVRPESVMHFRLPKSQVETLYKNPLCEVATHTYTHPHLKGLPESVLMKEIVDDRLALEEMFGGVVRGHAYPFGDCNDTIVDVWKKAGIVYARCTQAHQTFQLPTDWLRWQGTCRHRDPQFEELSDKFIKEEVKPDEHGWLFYVWGHTYEFRIDDNWDLIERVFEKVAGNDDVWYATNMEIYEYVNAWRSLVYSADGKCAYNPTAIDVWVKAAGKTVAVPAGKTICLF